MNRLLFALLLLPLLASAGLPLERIEVAPVPAPSAVRLSGAGDVVAAR